MNTPIWIESLTLTPRLVEQLILVKTDQGQSGYQLFIVAVGPTETLMVVRGGSSLETQEFRPAFFLGSGSSWKTRTPNALRAGLRLYLNIGERMPIQTSPIIPQGIALAFGADTRTFQEASLNALRGSDSQDYPEAPNGNSTSSGAADFSGEKDKTRTISSLMGLPQDMRLVAARALVSVPSSEFRWVLDHWVHQARVYELARN